MSVEEVGGAQEPGRGSSDPLVAIDYPERRPAGADWLGGKKAGLVLSFDLDAEAPVLTAGERYRDDLSAMSHQAYGPRVGVPRILDVLRDRDVKATFFVAGVNAARWPRAVEAVAAAGHEVALHGFSHLAPFEMAANEQRRDLEQGVAALGQLGIEPRGYRAPNWRQTRLTLELLAEAGFAYDSSLMDDDRPYVLGLDSGSLVELPVHWALDDWEQYAFLPEPRIGERIERPSVVFELWRQELAAMRSTQSLCMLTCHPFLSGRPSRIQAVSDLIDYALELGEVRISTGGEVADRLHRSS